MRYRPLGASGMALSCISLRLDGAHCSGESDAWLKFTHSAFENGVNAFELVSPTRQMLQGFGEALRVLERRLYFVGLRLSPGTAKDNAGEIAAVMEGTDLRALDLVTLDAESHPHTDAVWLLEELRTARRTRLIGVSGESDAVTPHIGSGVFDVLIAPFNILSGWRERIRVRTAVDRNMAVIAYGHFPEDARDLGASQPERRSGWFAKRPAALAGVGTYAFLNRTPGWTSEEICLGFALTEPSLASILLEVAGAEHLASLADVTERELPSAVAAQIEMARFSLEQAPTVERRRA